MRSEVTLLIQILWDKVDMNKEQEKEFKYSIKIGLNKKEMMKCNQNLTHLKIGEL